jgi:hypothetical protein
VAQHAAPGGVRAAKLSALAAEPGHRHDVDVALEQLAQPVAGAGGQSSSPYGGACPVEAARTASTTSRAAPAVLSLMKLRGNGSERPVKLAAGPAVAVGLAVGRAQRSGTTHRST